MIHRGVLVKVDRYFGIVLDVMQPLFMSGQTRYSQNQKQEQEDFIVTVFLANGLIVQVPSLEVTVVCLEGSEAPCSFREIIKTETFQ